MGPALKPRRRFDKGDKGVLCHVLGKLRTEAGSSGGAKHLGQVKADDLLERFGVALPDPRGEVRVVHTNSSAYVTRFHARHSVLGNPECKRSSSWNTH